MILVYLIIIAIVAFFSFKYIFGGKEAIRTRKNAYLQRKANSIWKKQFAANMVDIDAHWDEDYPKPKRQKIVVKGALKQFEDAWTEQGVTR